MRRHARRVRPPCQFPGCKVKAGRYGSPENDDRRYCSKHAQILWWRANPKHLLTLLEGGTAPTLTILMRAARALGATVDMQSLWWGRVNVDAPKGFVWACTGDIHAIVIDWHARENGRPEWPEEKAEAIRDALDRMAHGLAECDDPECDCCHEDLHGEADPEASKKDLGPRHQEMGT